MSLRDVKRLRTRANAGEREAARYMQVRQPGVARRFASPELRAGSPARSCAQVRQPGVARRFASPEGCMEISRWRKPPDLREKRHAPRQGRWDEASHVFPPPLPGRMFVGDVIRWLAPPANFVQASGLDPGC